MCGIGNITGVDAIVPPIPVRDIGDVMLNGALRVIEQPEGIVAANGVKRSGLHGGPIDTAKGMPDDEALLSLRSDRCEGCIASLFVSDDG
jgi:hypothetical protein